MRKIYLLLIAVLAFLPVAVRAQVPMTLKPNQQCYLRGERIFMQIGLRNDTGRVLIFGDIEQLSGSILFEVLDVRGYPVYGVSDVAFPVRNIMLRPGETKFLTANFSAQLPVLNTGIYRVRAYVKHPLLPDEYCSNWSRIQISEGTVLQSFPVGVPETTEPQKLDAKKATPVVGRCFTIRSMVDGVYRNYYVVLSDDKVVYQVIRLGAAVGIDPPTADVDMVNSLHVMCNVLAKIFKYLVVDIDGNIVSQKYYRTTNSAPTLVRTNGGGKVHVLGGAEALPGVDFDVEKSNVLPGSGSTI